MRNNLALAPPDVLREYPQHSKAALGSALTGLSIACGISKFLMGSVPDRSNPNYFLPLGLILSCAIMAATGLVKAVDSSLAILIVLQIGSAIAGSGVGWVADEWGWNGVFITMVACGILTIAFSAMDAWTYGHERCAEA